MVPRMGTLRGGNYGTSPRDNPVGTRGAYYKGAVKLGDSSGSLGTGCKDVQEDKLADWQEWISSVTVRYCTEAFYRSSRCIGNNENCPGHPCFPRRKACAELVTKCASELPCRLKMRTTHEKRGTDLDFETDVGGCRRITRSLSGSLLRRSTRNKALNPSRACELSKSAASRHNPVGSANWFLALKQLLNEKACVPKRRQQNVAGMPSLTRAMQREVEAALVPTPANEVLVSAFRINIRRADMHTLADGQWLNDEVINFYMNLLMERSKKEGSPNVYAFNTFFFPKLKSSGYAGVKRWTRNIDLFSFDIVLVPLHVQGTHWCLVAVDFRKNHIAYYDSLGAPPSSTACLSVLQQYLECESRQKRNDGITWDNWTVKAVDVPLQQNGNDCGMFACQYAECVSRDAQISFGQHHMPYFRKRVVYEILHKTMLSA